MRISLCVPCMGRAHHLQKTLPKNLVDNAGCDGLEIVVLDYNSKDGLEDWMRLEMADEIANGRVAYYRERAAKFFNPRHAKNVAHLLGRGEILVNIDADNFTGPGYAQKIIDLLSEPNVFMRADQAGPGSNRPKHMRGIAGRIAFRRESFLKLRGYDEICLGYGGEDSDITRRATLVGLRRVLLTWPGEDVIDHSNQERTARFEHGGNDVSCKPYNEIWHKRTADAAVNPDGYGRAAVLRGLSDEIVQVGVGPS